MSESTQAEEISTFNPPLFLTSLRRQYLYGAFIVIMTFLDFRFIELLQPDWQSGRLQDYITLFLSLEATLLFFPLLVYSIICFLLLIENQEHYASIFIIRFGIYTGAFLALQYSLLTILAVDDASPSSILLLLLLYASPLIVKKVYQWLSTKLSQVLIRYLAIGFGFIIVLVLLLVQGNLFFLPVLAFLGYVAPFWSFLISGQTALWLFKNYESKLTLFRSLGIFAWIAAYVGALRFNILKMYELYAALPTEPPNCYIATAAAKGHSQFVGSQNIKLKNGKRMQFNQQLQRLKFAEIALMAIFPVFHKWIRKIYDVLGKKLANYIKTPIIADIAFLFLLPVERASFFILKLIIPEIKDLAGKIYTS